MHALISPAPATSEPAAEQLATDLLALWRHVIGSGSGDPRAYAAFDELDLTLTQVKALCALTNAELTVKELAERLGLSLPGASRAVDALVARDLLHRREDPDDRRQRRLSSSSAGRRALERLDEARLAGIAAFAATLPAARCECLSRALRPIIDDLEEAGA